MAILLYAFATIFDYLVDYVLRLSLVYFCHFYRLGLWALDCFSGLFSLFYYTRTGINSRCLGLSSEGKSFHLHLETRIFSHRVLLHSLTRPLCSNRSKV